MGIIFLKFHSFICSSLLFSLFRIILLWLTTLCLIIIFFLIILWNLLFTGKEVMSRVKKVLSMLVATLLSYGRLNQVIFLLFAYCYCLL